MSCPYCRRDRAPEPSPAPAALSASPGPPAASPGPPPTRKSHRSARKGPRSARKGPRSARKGPRSARKNARKTGWLLPGILLVLMPKCPICLAAYIALVTGISIPLTAATWLRGSLIAGCIGALVWLAVRCSLYLYRRNVH